MSSKKLMLALAVLIWLTLHPQGTQADPITLTMNNVGAGLPGTTVSFQGTLANLGAPAVYLNGLSYTAPAGLSFNPLPFFLLPSVLNAGQSSGLATLFTVTIGAIPQGLYTGSFTILGGATSTSINSLLTRDFQVNVVPEPATLLLVGTALASLVARRRRKVLPAS